MIPYGRQHITQEDIDSVVDVLGSDFLTQGPRVPAFEKSIQDVCAVPYAVAVNSATSALHIACLALELGPGDILWTSPVTFVASANCGLYCGADVDFVDVDPKTYNLCPKALKEKLDSAASAGKLPKIIVAVHLSGQPCNMEEIHALAQSHGIKVIEDASHAIGGKYKNEPIGNCRYSDVTVFSFHPVKIVTTAEGGAATTKDQNLASRMDLFRSHGVTRNPDLMTKTPDGPWYYQQIELGYNYRLTELQAALGLSQFTKLEQFISARHRIAARYDELLDGLPLTKPWQHSDGYSGLHLYIIRLKLDEISKSHCEVFEELRANGIGVNLHYIPVHLQPVYAARGFKYGDFPNAESYYAEAISIPLYPDLTEELQDRVVGVLKSVLS